MAVFSLVCSALPVNPFGNVSSLVGENGTLISWEYWGPEKNVYVEYKSENSKQSNTPLFLAVPRIGGKRPLLHYWLVQVNRNFGTSRCRWLLPTWSPDVINKAPCDWIANYPSPVLDWSSMHLP